MGEILQFPGRRPDRLVQQRQFPTRAVLPGGFDQAIRGIMGRLSEDGRRLLEASMAEVAEISGQGDRQHQVRADKENQWWEAHGLGDLERQTETERQIGVLFGPRRGGKIIDRLRMVANIHKAHEEHNPGDGS